MQTVSNSPPEWISELRARGWANAALTVLDVLEPFGALGAQLLYVTSPTLGVLGWRNPAEGLAQALETPEGIEQIRRWLQDSAEDG